jgi:hypothetical protein
MADSPPVVVEEGRARFGENRLSWAGDVVGEGVGGGGDVMGTEVVVWTCFCARWAPRSSRSGGQARRTPKGEMRAVSKDERLPALALGGWVGELSQVGVSITVASSTTGGDGDVPPLRLTAVMASVDSNAVGLETRRQSTGGWFKGREPLMGLITLQ